eukprot:jgi/Mesvir1/20451/Mv12347-RA.1
MASVCACTPAVFLVEPLVEHRNRRCAPVHPTALRSVGLNPFRPRGLKLPVVQHAPFRSTLQNKSTRRTTCASLGNGIVECAPHLRDYIENLPLIQNPIAAQPELECAEEVFVTQREFVAQKVVRIDSPDDDDGLYFEKAGPRPNIYFNPTDVTAAIVTCGGLCPGLNSVIREIVNSLWINYGVRNILGVQNGYRGFYAADMLRLTPRLVNAIHHKGGSILGCGRGVQDTDRILNSLVDREINMVFILGGDGTQRGAYELYRAARKRKLKISICGIPETVDNDVPIVDKSFGFDSAVEEAQRAISSAHVEAESFPNGVGIVKLMGQKTGFIAMHATLASRDVDCCLIPEVPFYLEGKGGLYEFVRHRLNQNGHVVIVLAEGAGREAMSARASYTPEEDDEGLLCTCGDSGSNAGLWLAERLKEHFNTDNKRPGLSRGPLSIKYIDPTYMIRAIPPNATDNIYSSSIARAAVHGAFAGYTGFVTGSLNGHRCYIPMECIVADGGIVRVNVTGRLWAKVLAMTSQPTFRPVVERSAVGEGEGQSGQVVAKSDSPQGVYRHQDEFTDAMLKNPLLAMEYCHTLQDDPLCAAFNGYEQYHVTT